MCLEAFSMDNRGAILDVILLRNPQWFEAAESRENSATNPSRVLLLMRSTDFDVHL